MKDQRIFGELIRAMREHHERSQGQLGAACAPPRTQSAVAQWESGQHSVGEDVIAIAAAALGYDSVREFMRAGLRVLDQQDRQAARERERQAATDASDSAPTPVPEGEP